MYDDIVQLQESRQKEQESVETNRDPPKHPNEETPADQRAKADTENDTDSAYECVIVCADEDGKVERWFSAPVDLRFVVKSEICKCNENKVLFNSWGLGKNMFGSDVVHKTFLMLETYCRRANLVATIVIKYFNQLTP